MNKIEQVVSSISLKSLVSELKKYKATYIAILKEQGSPSTTASAYCCWVGVVSPMLFILDYPLFTFVPVTNFVNPRSITLISLPLWVHIWNAVVFIEMLVLTFLIPLRWLSDIQRISRLRLIAALIVIYFPVMSLHNVLIAPYVAKGLEIFSKFLSKLI